MTLFVWYDIVWGKNKIERMLLHKILHMKVLEMFKVPKLSEYAG